MKKIFRHGLVVGKFSPLHRGHELIIQRAIAECDEVTVISYSVPEFKGCEAHRRELWLTKLFPMIRCLVISEETIAGWKRQYKLDMKLPPNDAPDDDHRYFIYQISKNILHTQFDAVFTSESYGDGFAARLSESYRQDDIHAAAVKHVLVDQERKLVSISGTQIRTDIHAHRRWLSPAVYASFVHRICLLGGESSGKSTLAKALAEHFNTKFVPEYGRELWEHKKGNLVFEDMLHIAQEQIAREEQAAQEANRFFFCDTSPLTTLFYSNHLFGKIDSALVGLAKRSYDLMVLCDINFPFMQDGTRQPASFRELQHQWYLEELKKRRIPFTLVSGVVDKRIDQICEKIFGSYCL